MADEQLAGHMQERYQYQQCIDKGAQQQAQAYEAEVQYDAEEKENARASIMTI